MSFTYYLNFEKLSQKIIEDEIQKMGDNNIKFLDSSFTDKELDESAFIENLHHGAIAITFIVNLYETALNTIISKKLKWTSEDILRSSHSLKLQIICYEYNVDFSKIKADHSYEIVNEAIRVRNDITHYKMNVLCVGTWVWHDAKIPFGKSKKTLAEIFTKTNVKRYYEGTLKFLRLICQYCDMTLNEKCLIIDCDGANFNYEFICTNDEYVEESMD